VNRTVREWLIELEAQNPVEEPTHNQDKVSTTDPDSTYATKGGTPARMGYYNNYLVDNHRCIIVGVQATGARLSEESRAAEEMITHFSQWRGKNPQSVVADASYGNGELLQWLMGRQITPYMPTRDAVARTRSPLFGPERFTYQPQSDSYLCPAGQQLNYGGRNDRNRAFAYIGTRPKCGPCPLKSQCTRGAFRFLAIHMNEAAAAGTGSLEHTGVRACTATTEKGRGTIRRAQESHRPSSPSSSPVEVRPGAVLPRCHRTEHQTIGTIPEHTNNRPGNGCRIGGRPEHCQALGDLSTR
jgi:Transposase DDE domain